jgi:hypothetical protein
VVIICGPSDFLDDEDEPEHPINDIPVAITVQLKSFSFFTSLLNWFMF